MGLPSGTLWAISDIDVTKENGFADTPFTYEKSYFSWGNVDGHNPTSENSFSPWDWGSVNAQAPYYEGQVYGNTPGNTLTSNVPEDEEYDAARANLGATWRMPTNAEYEELFNNIIFINADGSEIPAEQTDKRVTVNDIKGIYIQSIINGARMFFACSGYGRLTSLNSKELNGYYWNADWRSARSAHCLYFDNNTVDVHNVEARYGGFPVRAVRVGNS